MQFSSTLSFFLVSVLALQVVLGFTEAKKSSSSDNDLSRTHGKKSKKVFKPCEVCTSEQGCYDDPRNSQVDEAYTEENGFVYQAQDDDNYWFTKLEKDSFLTIVNVCAKSAKSKLFRLESFYGQGDNDFNSTWIKVGCGHTCYSHVSRGDDMSKFPDFVTKVVYYEGRAPGKKSVPEVKKDT